MKPPSNKCHACLAVAVLAFLLTGLSEAVASDNPATTAPADTTEPARRLPPQAPATPDGQALLQNLQNQLESLDRRLAPIERTGSESASELARLKSDLDALANDLGRQSDSLGRMQNHLQVLATTSDIQGIQEALNSRLTTIAQDVDRVVNLIPAQEPQPSNAGLSPLLVLLTGMILGVLVLQISAAAGLLPRKPRTVSRAPAPATPMAAAQPAPLPKEFSAALRSLETMAEKLHQAERTLEAAFQRLAGLPETLAPRIQALPGELEARLQPVVNHLAAQAEKLSTDAADLDASRRRLEAVEQEIEQRSRGSAEAARAALRVLPLWLQPDGCLAPWKDGLLAAVQENRSSALRLLAAMLDWQALTSAAQPAREEVARLAFSLSLHLHDFLHEQYGSDQSASVDAVQAWLKAVRDSAAEVCPDLEIKAVYPGDRFDTDRMESRQSLSGNRFAVSRALSWLVLDRAGDKHRILHRAHVITT